MNGNCIIVQTMHIQRKIKSISKHSLFQTATRSCHSMNFGAQCWLIADYLLMTNMCSCTLLDINARPVRASQQTNSITDICLDTLSCKVGWRLPLCHSCRSIVIVGAPFTCVVHLPGRILCRHCLFSTRCVSKCSQSKALALQGCPGKGHKCVPIQDQRTER